jgi:hypothetical protein
MERAFGMKHMQGEMLVISHVEAVGRNWGYLVFCVVLFATLGPPPAWEGLTLGDFARSWLALRASTTLSSV